jgi:hypothetical protein
MNIVQKMNVDKDNVNDKVKAMIQRSLSGFPNIYFSKDSNNKCVCPICYDILDTCETITHTLCGHVFHQRCIMGWLQCHHSNNVSEPTHAKCPICQQPVASLFSHTFSSHRIILGWKDIILIWLIVMVSFSIILMAISTI